MRRDRPMLENSFKLAAIWLALLAAVAGALALYQRHALVAELEQESNVLHRLASQRADQHDAHLTSLSAVAVAAGAERRDLFLDVAATITRFYPRIDEMLLAPLDPRAETIGTGPLDPATADLVRSAAHASDGQVSLMPYPGKPDHYIIVKRSPNSDAALYGLMLAVDARKLLEDAGPFWLRPGVMLRLTLPNGHPLVSQPERTPAIRFSKVLSSASQPLLLETGTDVGFADLLPPRRTALVLVLASLTYLAILGVLRQRARARVAVEQARLSALETRLAHASRVNTLGEMASGLAHELTQPLTAILAQAQAGRRLLDRGDAAALASVFDDTVSQARRGSAILERFRNWSRPQRAMVVSIDLGDTLRNVQALLAQEAAAQGVRLDFAMPQQPVTVVADPVEMEQVAFNLVRNAIEASGGGAEAGLVSITLTQDSGRALLEISDNGPGVAEDLRPRLFTPFTTTRADGTGLGLALSQRLVERAGGEIALADGGPGATFRVVLPRSEGAMEAAQ
ncbi:MAG: sensor histidine kinase [Rhizobiaceae bacterium]